MKNTEEAFKWIVGILKKNKVHFQITGGLAAKFYGSIRPLADIDIDIRGDKFESILEDVKEYITMGPQRFMNDNWDLYMMTLRFKNQDIDIDSGDVKIRPNKEGQWVSNITDFSKSGQGEIFGVTVPIIPKEELINYKKILSREVDIEDIKNLSR